METAGDRQTGEIRTERDEYLRQCISQTRTSLIVIALTSLFAIQVRVVDVRVQLVVMVPG
jgi:hypothetical protein